MIPHDPLSGSRPHRPLSWTVIVDIVETSHLSCTLGIWISFPLHSLHCQISISFGVVGLVIHHEEILLMRGIFRISKGCFYSKSFTPVRLIDIHTSPLIKLLKPSHPSPVPHPETIEHPALPGVSPLLILVAVIDLHGIVRPCWIVEPWHVIDLCQVRLPSLWQCSGRHPVRDRSHPGTFVSIDKSASIHR